MNNSKYNWIKQGLIWGLFMFLSLTFLVPYLSDEEIKLNKILIAIPAWLMGGLLYGFITNKFKD